MLMILVVIDLETRNPYETQVITTGYHKHYFQDIFNAGTAQWEDLKIRKHRGTHAADAVSLVSLFLLYPLSL